MRPGVEHGVARRKALKHKRSFIEMEDLPSDNSDQHLFERDVDGVGPKDIEFETQSKVPGIDSTIQRRDEPLIRDPIMSSKLAAKNSLDLLNVKSKTPKKLFNLTENRAMVDRSPGDSLYGDDKETQGRHIRNMKGPGGLKTGSIKKIAFVSGEKVSWDGGEGTYVTGPFPLSAFESKYPEQFQILIDDPSVAFDGNTPTILAEWSDDQGPVLVPVDLIETTAKTGMVKKADLNIGDDIVSEGEIYKVSSISDRGVIARHAFNSMDRHFDSESFQRIANTGFVEKPVKEVKESAVAPLFFQEAAEDGLFPVHGDDTIHTDR